ncbi:MAG: DUF2142 domain-containing protein [Lachnospiraceae bacterium]|nr:DUF2142 domain-containing protein [Lachnospiraceae bacterium]
MIKNKKLIAAYLLIGIIAFVFILVILLQIKEADSTYVLFPNGGTVLGELKTGDKITQEVFFDNECEIDIGIFFATYENTEKNSGSLTVIAEDIQGNRQAEKKVDISTIEDWSYVYISINGTKFQEQKAVIKIIIDELGEDTRLTCITSDSDASNYQMIYNGKKQDKTISILINYKNLEKYTLFSISVICILTIIISIILLLIFKNIQYEKIFCAMAVGVGIVYMILLPVQMAPDEPSHIATAYTISNKILGMDIRSEDGYIYMRKCDKYCAYLLRPYNEDIVKLYDSFLKIPSEKDKEMTETKAMGLNTTKEAYLLSALGITIGRILGLNGEITFLLGRIFNYILFVLVTYFAVKRIPYGKVTLILISMLPMVLQQAISYSYDSLLLTMCMAFITYFCLLIHDDYVIKNKDIVFLAIVSLILSRLKGSGYMPLVFLLLIPIIKYRKDKTKKKMVYALIGILIGVTVWKIGDMAMSSSSSVTENNETYYTLAYLLENKKNTILVFFNTFWLHIDFYLFSCLGFSLGWLEISIPTALFVVYLFVLFLSMIPIKEPEEGFNIKQKIFSIFMSLISICGICMALLLSWTTKDFTSIEGVQGRYFLPVLIVLLFVLRNNLLIIRKNINKYLICFSVIFQYFVVYAVLMYYIR